MLAMLNRHRRWPTVRLLSELRISGREFSDKDDDGKKKLAASKLQELLSKLAEESAKVKETHVAKTVKVSTPIKRKVEKRPVEKIRLEKIANQHTAKLVGAVKEVADHVSSTPAEVRATEAELLHVILNNKRPGEKSPEDLKLSNVISGLQVEKSKERQDSRAEQVRRSMAPERKQRFVKRERTFSDRPTTGLDIFGAKPLGIFPSDMSAEPTCELQTWRHLSEKDLKLRVTHPPSNVYEEMIRWTDRGQLWKFPIDNEQGLEDEKATDFTQHVFLEEHLEPWCPTKGPVKQFMDLVLIGLSKNPHLTVSAKIEHIHWFRDYFEGKRKVLVETGSLPDEARPKEISS